MATDEELGLDVRMFVDGAGPPDLDPLFAEIDGAEAVAQVVALRCYTPRFPAPGYLLGSENEGIFLPDFVQGKLDAKTKFIVQQLVRAQARKDERVESTRVDVTTDAAAQTMTIDIAGTTSDDEPFELTISVSDVTVELLNES
jgi:hypothetical protein